MATLNAVYASPGYSASVHHLAAVSYASDLVLSDGVTLQMASMSGTVVDAYVAQLNIAVSG